MAKWQMASYSSEGLGWRVHYLVVFCTLVQHFGAVNFWSFIARLTIKLQLNSLPTGSTNYNILSLKLEKTDVHCSELFSLSWFGIKCMMGSLELRLLLRSALRSASMLAEVALSIARLAAEIVLFLFVQFACHGWFASWQNTLKLYLVCHSH